MDYVVNRRKWCKAVMFSWRENTTPSMSVCAVVLYILRAVYCFYSHCQMTSAQSWDIFSISQRRWLPFSGGFNHVNRHLDLGAEILEGMFTLEKLGLLLRNQLLIYFLDH